MSHDSAAHESLPPRDSSTRLGRARGGKRSLALLLSLVAVWGLLMQQFGDGDVYGVMGPFALAVVGVVNVLLTSALRSWFKPDARRVLAGLALGGAMTALTYPVFHLAVRLVPALEPIVRRLYAAAESQRMSPRALAWVAVLVLAEELLWRGALFDALERRTSRPLAFTLSVLSYALAQLGSGSWLVFVLALVCGTIWTFARVYSGSLVVSTLSHLIWTECVILILPVT